MKRWLKAGIAGIFLYPIVLFVDYLLTCKVIEPWLEACKKFWIVISPAQYILSFFRLNIDYESSLIQILTPFAFIILAILIERVITGLIASIKWAIKTWKVKIKVFNFKVVLSILLGVSISLFKGVMSSFDLYEFILGVIINTIIIILVWTAFESEQINVK
jgi:hypothetical protein